MKEQNLDDILNKLKFGSTISEDARIYIAFKLNSFDNNEELEQAIRAFGLSNNASTENIKEIEKYLESKSDIVLSGVIKVLCANSYWGLTKHYIDILKGFLKKEDAFELSETQIIIFSVIGEYLHKSSDVHLFEFLYRLFIKELEEYKSDQDYFHKARLERMYHCLDVGIRGREAELEYRVGRMELPNDINQDIMMDIVKLIRKKGKRNTNKAPH